MALWDNLLKRAVSPLIEQEVEKLRTEYTAKDKEEAVEKGLMMLESSNRGYYSPSRGINQTSDLQLHQKGVSFDTLRKFSLFYPILRACVNYRKRQITQLEWDVSAIEVNLKDKKGEAKMNPEDESDKKDIAMVKEFLRYPIGDKITSFRNFINKVIEDTMVLDAVAIYRKRNMKGGIFGYIPIDATTIELALNEDGSVPLPPERAYIQKVGGKVTAELTTDDLIYRMMNPRTNTPFGLSPVETLILTVSTALKLGSYNLSYLTEGNVPEGFVELPQDIASSPDQLKAWQEAWDAMMSGNNMYRRKIKFLPTGMKWTPTKTAEDMSFERFEKWLLLQTCSVMEVPPQAIGFQFDRGKGATEAEWEIGKERGLYPLANFIKEIMDQIIQEDLSMPHLEFTWQNINPTNKKEESDVFAKLVNTGAVSVDEWRLGEGLAPIGLPHFIMTPVGPILVRDFVEASDKGTPLIPYNYQNQGANATISGGAGEKPTAPSTNNVKAKKPTGFQTQQQPAKKVAQVDIVEELKRWKKVVSKDIKAGQSFRDFKSDILNTRTQTLIKDGLKSVKTREELDELFNPLISQENNIISDVLDLYDNITRITNGQ